MELVKLTVEEFSKVMASDAPAPGGGSAAALAGALGSGLTAMVSALTIGKKKYADVQDLVTATQAKANALQEELVAAIDSDTEAFNVISAAFGMPKGTDEEKAARSAAIQEGLIACIESPLRIMELSAEAVKLAEGICGKANASAASDLGVSVLMLGTALRGAWLNVLINLGSLKDKEKAEVYRAKGEAILESAGLSDKLFAKIEESLR